MKNSKILFGIISMIILAFSACQVSENASDSASPTTTPSNPNSNINVQQNANAPAQAQNVPNQQAQQLQVQRGIGNIENVRRPNYDTFPEPPAPPFARNRIQVALLLDTSNSMDGLIDQAKSQLWKMVNELAKSTKEEQPPQIELSLFEYGNDWLTEASGHIRKVSRLTIDLEFVSDRLFELKTNGGNEYCGWAVKDATEILDWSDNPNDLKIIFIAGNEEYTQGPVDYKMACLKAKEKGIIINTIHCGDYDTGIRHMWGDGAKCSGGQYMNIDQDKKVVHIPTPYDDKVLELNKKLNDTYFGYGSLGESRKHMQMANDVKASGYSSANTRTRTFYKTKKNYSNASWDIVDATEENYDEVMSDIKTEELPEEMQKMSKEEQKTFIEEKRKERKELQAELKELEKKVDAFVTEKKKEMAAESGDDTLDNVMMSTIRKQAEAKGFVFE